MKRTRRIIFGAVSGIVSGVGATVILVQGGAVPFRVDWVWALPVGTAAMGAFLGAVAHIAWLRRVSRALIVLYVLGVFVGGFAPAYGQGVCIFGALANAETKLDGSVRVGGQEVCLENTSESSPWVVDVSRVDRIEVFAEHGAIEHPSARLVLGTVGGLGAIPQLEGRVLWEGPSDDLYHRLGIGLDVNTVGLVTVTVSDSSVTLPALGVYGVILETADGVDVASGFVRLTTPPFTNAIGIAGSVAAFLGALGMALAGRAPRGGTVEPSPPPMVPEAEWIPSNGTPHAGYVDTRFIDPDTGQQVPVREPLVLHKEYRLEININPAVEAKREDRDASDEILLTVVPQSSHFDVAATLTLGTPGTPLQLAIPVKPQRSSSPAELRLDIFSNGHLLQSERVYADLVATEGEVGGPQGTMTVFSASDFSSADVENRQPRSMTLIVELDQRDDSVDCRFVDNAHGQTAAFDTRLPVEALITATRNVRGRLIEMLSGSIKGVQGYWETSDGTVDQLDAWLPHLADGGRDLFKALFPELGRRDTTEPIDLATTVEAGSIIQVNQSYAGIGSATVPWAFLYDRPVIVDETSRACDNYTNHGPTDCPYGDAPEVVCPWGFWGYRYVIEQPPSWVGERLPPPTVHRLENDRPLVMSFTVDPSLALWEDHLETLSAVAELEVLLAEGFAELRAHWAASADRMDLVYFYCHHGQDPDGGGSWLRVGMDEVGTNDIEAIAPTNSWSDHPIVFLNGCATGDYALESYESFINEFRRAGAAGVIGTECKIREFMAEDYAGMLFPKVFSGQAVGAAMLELRRSFLAERQSMAAFLYSLFAPGDIALSAPVARTAP